MNNTAPGAENPGTDSVDGGASPSDSQRPTGAVVVLYKGGEVVAFASEQELVSGRLNDGRRLVFRPARRRTKRCDPVGHRATARRQKYQEMASPENLSIREQKLLKRISALDAKKSRCALLISLEDIGKLDASDRPELFRIKETRLLEKIQREYFEIREALSAALDIRKRWASRCQDPEADLRLRVSTKRAKERATYLGLEEIEATGGTRLPSERKNGFMWTSNYGFDQSDNHE